jgi:hypothetical protein
MSLYHRRLQLLVPEKLLHSADVVTDFEKLRGKRMTKSMAGVRFRQTSLPYHGPFSKPLKRCHTQHLSAAGQGRVFERVGVPPR